MIKTILICIVLCCCFLGCGSTDGTLNTSFVTANVDKPDMDSDVVNWVDNNGTKSTACATASFPSLPAADSVNVTVTSTPYSNTGPNGASIRLGTATISYVPANSTTPQMPSEYQTIGMTITNGGAVTVPVRVATQEQKASLYSALACNISIYKYYTKISIDITEIGTDKKSTVDAFMNLRFADFIDK